MSTFYNGHVKVTLFFLSMVHIYLVVIAVLVNYVLCSSNYYLHIFFLTIPNVHICGTES